MIAKKAKRSASFAPRIDYVLEEVEGEQRGKFIGCTDDLYQIVCTNDKIDASAISKLMQLQSAKNSKVQKACYHQIFSFPIGERPTDDILEDISQEFARDFGFEQWLSVKHEDTDHLHIHFVGNIVGNNGKVTVNDSNDYYKLNDFVKYIHERHSLQKVGEIKAPFEERSDKHIDRLKSIIDKALALDKVDDLKTFQNELLKFGIKSFTKRGITFIDKYSGVEFKGSKLGKDYSLKSIEKRIGDKLNLSTKLDPLSELKQLIKLESLQAVNLENLEKRLAEKGCISSLVGKSFEYKYNGKTVLEKDLGIDYSINQIRFNIGRNQWISKNETVDVLKTTIDNSLKKPSVFSVDTLKDELNESGWSLSLEEKKFKNTEGNEIQYTQVIFKQIATGLKISDQDIKDKNYSFTGLNKKFTQRVKKDFDKKTLVEAIKLGVLEASNFEDLSVVLKSKGIDILKSSYLDKDTREEKEILRYKKDNLIFTSRELDENGDVGLDNVKFNLSSTTDEQYVTRADTKKELIESIKGVFEDNSNEITSFQQFSNEMNKRGWSLEMNDRFFKLNDSIIEYQELKYRSLSNPLKFVNDNELRERKNSDENNSSNYSLKEIKQSLTKNRAAFVRNSLVVALENATSFNDLSFRMYQENGILLSREPKEFVSRDYKVINYRELTFRICDEKNRGMVKADFDNNYKAMIANHKGDKIELNQVNQYSGEKKITSKDLSDFFSMNAQGQINSQDTNLAQGRSHSNSDDRFWEDLKKDLLGKVSQSGNVSFKGDREQDIRSFEEKRKDELRRLGKL